MSLQLSSGAQAETLRLPEPRSQTALVPHDPARDMVRRDIRSLTRARAPPSTLARIQQPEIPRRPAGALLATSRALGLLWVVTCLRLGPHINSRISHGALGAARGGRCIAGASE
jgi:hypothetical protein